MSELSDVDFKILEFINENEPVEIKKIKSKFPEIASIGYQIEQMSKQTFSQSGSCYIPNTSFIIQEYEEFEEPKGSFEPAKPLGIYTVTDFGKKALQDHKEYTKNRKKELWLKNAWIPIIVSFVTTATTMYIVPKLPYLLKLLIDIFQKIF